MKHLLLLIVLLFGFSSCEKETVQVDPVTTFRTIQIEEVERPFLIDYRHDYNPSNCRLSEEKLDCIANNFIISVNNCTGQIHLVYQYENGDGTFVNWGASFDVETPIDNCITYFTHN